MPRIFVRLSKAISAHLRKKLIDILIYIDDSLICGQNFRELCKQRNEALKVFEECGFTINKEKSCLTPAKQIDFLGFRLNSQEYTIELLKKKKVAIKNFASKLLHARTVSIRNIAKMIGLCVATFPATCHGQLLYRVMERFKVKMLLLHNANWSKQVKISHNCRMEIHWWLRNVDSSLFKKQLYKKEIDYELTTNSSKTGWGCCFNNTEHANGKHRLQHAGKSINTKELLAIFYALRCFSSKLAGRKVLILTDNTTALSCLKKQGPMHYLRDIVTKDICKILFRYKIEMVATFIPGKVNKAADFQSRHFRNLRVEWSLDNSTMELIHRTGRFFDIDLFASFLNNKHSRYVSWHRDLFSCFVDSF